MHSRRVPKARSLLDLLSSFESPLTADFQRVYSLRLVDVVTTRDENEILSLVEWLPAGSALHASIEAKGNETKAHQLFGWDVNSDLQLGVANLVQNMSYILHQANSQKRVTPPEPISGPRDADKRKRGSNDAGGMARALLQAQKG